jgi:hypothetical protein
MYAEVLPVADLQFETTFSYSTNLLKLFNTPSVPYSCRGFGSNLKYHHDKNYGTEGAGDSPIF